MSYYINTEERTITLKKKNHNHSKTKNNMNNINNFYNFSHPCNCKCKCHNIRYTTSIQPKIMIHKQTQMFPNIKIYIIIYHIIIIQ